MSWYDLWRLFKVAVFWALVFIAVSMICMLPNPFYK